MQLLFTEQKTNISTRNVLYTTNGIANLYLGMGKNIATFFAFILLLPATPLLLLAYILGLVIPTLIVTRKLRDTFDLVRNFKIKSERDYETLREAYQEFGKYIEMKVPVEEFPSYVRFFFIPHTKQVKLVEELRIILAEKLYLRPKGVSDEELRKISASNKNLEGYFDEEDEFDYSKALALGKIEFIER